MPNKKTQPATKKKAQQSRRAGPGRSTSGPLPPYGVAIRESIARGDVREMRRMAVVARKWLKDTVLGDEDDFGYQGNSGSS